MKKILKQNKPKILLLYDLPEDTTSHDDLRSLLTNSDRPTERDVARALINLGFELHIWGLFDDVQGYWQRLLDLNPDVIVNLCETFRGQRRHEGDVASLIELSGVPYTGSTPAALHLCKDKAVTKQIANWHQIRTPKFKVIPRGTELAHHEHLTFPVIVKPLNLEASEGISQASIVADEQSCRERSSWVHQRLHADVIVEEYIHGRELYVGVLEGQEGAKAFYPRELLFAHLEKTQPMIASYKAKWDEKYREKWGISTVHANALSEIATKNIMNQSIQLFKALGLSGYARMDWRLGENGELYFLEANPNPALSSDDDFAKSGEASGYTYEQLIDQVMRCAYSKNSSATPQPDRRSQNFGLRRIPA